MHHFKTIKLETSESAATLSLSRPEKRNAINATMAREIMEALNIAAENADLHALVLRGEGSSFCAGADLHWMNSTNMPEEETPDHLLPLLFGSIFRFPLPLIVVAHGNLMGGALGLLAAGDFNLAQASTRFSFSEVRLGLVPATISPFVIRRIGEYAARRLMLGGDIIGTESALEVGLIDMAAGDAELEQALNGILSKLSGNAPGAMKTCKALIQRVAVSQIDDALMAHTARILKEVRQSDEAREGFRAFKEKRKAVWRKK